MSKQIYFCGLLWLLTFPAIAGDGKQTFVAKDKEGFHLYLLIGQSNMAGRARIPADAKGNIPNVYLLNQEGEWNSAANPLNQYSTIRKK